jgi:hypothetical protein
MTEKETFGLLLGTGEAAQRKTHKDITDNFLSLVWLLSMRTMKQQILN